MSSTPDHSSPSVLVTGSSSGIGRACALELHRQGYRVFAGVRRQADADELVELTSPLLTPVMLDVTDAESIAAAASLVGRQTNDRGLAGLVNNAGISVACPLEFIPLDTFRQQFEVNVFGALAVTQAMLPMLRAARGRVVNISSLSGLVAGPYVGAYAASKHALEAMSDSLRVELRRFGVRVAVVEPADIDTPIWEKSRARSEAIRDKLLDQLGERVTAEVEDHYRADLTAMREATSRFAAQALPVERVTRAVTHALAAKRPRTRYRVGLKTWGAWILRRLPDALRDRIVLRNLGMR